MIKIRMGVCLALLACALSACSAEPPDLYMIPTSEKTASTQGGLLVLEEDEDLKKEKERLNAEVIEMNQLMYVVEGVNIREKNDMSSPVVSSLEAGIQVQVTGKCNNGWYRIVEQDRTAFIKEEYLSESMPGTALAEGETLEEVETTLVPETSETSETTQVQTTAAATLPTQITEAATEMDATTEVPTEPETTQKPIEMINTYSLAGVVTNIGAYGFTVQGKDKQSYRFTCAPDITAPLKEGSYVVVQYNSSTETGQTELVSVSGQ